jgi:hypothetical protein
VLYKELSYVGLRCTDFESFIGIVSDEFDLTREHFAASLAINSIPVLLYSKPTYACNDSNCGSRGHYCDDPSHRYRPASVSC